MSEYHDHHHRIEGKIGYRIEFRTQRRSRLQCTGNIPVQHIRDPAPYIDKKKPGRQHIRKQQRKRADQPAQSDDVCKILFHSIKIITLMQAPE